MPSLKDDPIAFALATIAWTTCFISAFTIAATFRAYSALKGKGWN